MRHGQGVELAFVLCSATIYAGYHVWLFVLLPRMRAARRSKSSHVIISQVSKCAPPMHVFVFHFIRIS